MMLVSMASRLAKSEAVAQDGIGEDVAFSLMVWRDEGLTAVCQLDADLSDETADERLRRTIEIAAICRRGFDATAFTFVTEGYCATDPDAVDSETPLATQFVTNRDVSECLTITHVESGNTYLLALPYRYDVGRKVVWSAPLRYVAHNSPTDFTVAMTEVLMMETEQPWVDEETWRDLVAEDVARWGFHVQYGMELDD
jgi:hypothetical protein